MAVWLTAAVAVLCFIGAFFNPVAGLLFAILFGCLAAGIHRKRAWAAIAAFCVLVVPVLVMIPQMDRGILVPFAISSVIQLIVAVFVFAAARELWRDPTASRHPGGWIAALGLFGIYLLSFRPYAMPSESMSNTLLAGDTLLAETASWHLGREPQRDQIVIYRYPVDPKQTFIKRIAGAPGDRIRIVNKQLIRNGEPVHEPWATHSTNYIDPFRDNFPSEPTAALPEQGTKMLQRHVESGEVIVPPGQYFVLGDNRDNSLDSRYTGFISRSDIVGSPLLIYGSFRRDGMSSILNLRWGRLFRRPA